MFKRFFATLIALAAVSPLGATEMAGVQFADKAKVGDQELVLNGLGLRTKMVFKVYAAGLYLAQKQSDAAKILAEDSARLFEMEMLRSVGKDKMVEAWNECLANNNPGASAEIKAGFSQLQSFMGDLATGDRLSYSYKPGEGTSVTVKGAAKGTIAGKAFADAVFKCWIGPTPPTEELKKGLLGL